MTLPASLAIGALAFGTPLAAALPGIPDWSSNPLAQNANADFRCFSVNAGENHSLSGMACTTPTGSQTVGAVDKTFTLATINGNWSCRHGNVTSAIQGIDAPAGLPVNVQGSDCNHVVADQQAQQDQQHARDQHSKQNKLQGTRSMNQQRPADESTSEDQRDVISDQQTSVAQDQGSQADWMSQNSNEQRQQNRDQSQNRGSNSSREAGQSQSQQSSQDRDRSEAEQSDTSNTHHQSTARDADQQDHDSTSRQDDQRPKGGKSSGVITQQQGHSTQDQ